MEYCLITGETLDESTKKEHTILSSLGGQITSKRFTSSHFNQKCGNTVDNSLANVFKHIFAILAPVTIANADPGNVTYTSLRYRYTKTIVCLLKKVSKSESLRKG